MCGIAGFLNWPMPEAGAAPCAEAMARALTHRGPDDSAIWRSEEGALYFAHRRLAVIDLTPTGRQPMTSADGRWTICFNGEIYNHAELRARLGGDGVSLRGRADTEALLESVARYGLEAALAAAEGMFAFAVWDAAERRLFLARDRAGVKPLYWLRQGKGFAFASEIKALRALPGARFELDRVALAEFLLYGYVRAPETMFAGVRKLEPGAILAVGADGSVSSRRYWRADGAAQDDTRSDADLTDALDALVRRTVRQEMAADVQVGCFLSGGVDSSLVAALAQQSSAGRLETFSVGFDDPSIDESAHARAVAEYIGARHHALNVDAAAAAEVLPLLPEMYDEPLADMAAIPTYLVSKLARSHVTVALSGDGGDELFGGYERYWVAERVWRRLSAAPGPARRMAAGALAHTPEALLGLAAQVVQPGLSRRHARARFARLIAALAARRPADVYRATTSLWLDPGEILLDAPQEPAPDWPSAASVVTAFQLQDFGAYLPDDVLAKVDRASMAVSLESRVPLLNHGMIAFAFALPDHVKRRAGRGKWLLRQVLARHVPADLVERPKQGFSVPMAAWLRGPLKHWADDLLDEAALAQTGLFTPGPIAKRWREHCSGVADWSYALWAVLTFEAWRRHWHL